MKSNECPEPICPINLYFKEDEGILCDSAKCDWDIESRSCESKCDVTRNSTPKPQEERN